MLDITIWHLWFTAVLIFIWIGLLKLQTCSWFHLVRTSVFSTESLMSCVWGEKHTISYPAFLHLTNFFCINLRTLLKCHFTLTFSTGVPCIPQSVILEVTFALIFKMGKLTIFRKCLSSWQCKLILKNQKKFVYAESVTNSDSQVWTGPGLSFLWESYRKPLMRCFTQNTVRIVYDQRPID